MKRSRITQHGVLELKVLRSFSETGTTYSAKNSKDWIKSGVEQASAYRDSKEAEWGALLCFDMRSKDLGDSACFKHVEALAKTCQVILSRWFVYSSSARLRTALAAAKA